MVVVGYSINGYWWLFDQWLLVAIRSMVIVSYYINDNSINGH
jgi:hypothetical protein